MIRAHPECRLPPEEEQARRLATAVGYAGSCAEYLYNTDLYFKYLGIRVTDLWRMQAMVAKEIDRIFADSEVGTEASGAGSDLA